MTTDLNLFASLVAAREYIVENGWTQRIAWNGNGESCLRGALYKVSGCWNLDAEEELKRAINPDIVNKIIIKDCDIYVSKIVTEFNDEYCKSKDEAIALFDKAINTTEDRIASSEIEEQELIPA